MLHGFQFSWLDQWPFLRYDEGRDVVFCHTCVMTVKHKRMNEAESQRRWKANFVFQSGFLIKIKNTSANFISQIMAINIIVKSCASCTFIALPLLNCLLQPCRWVCCDLCLYKNIIYIFSKWSCCTGHTAVRLVTWMIACGSVFSNWIIIAGVSHCKLAWV